MTDETPAPPLDNDLPPSPPPAGIAGEAPTSPAIQVAADRAVEKAEARATRRRWITLAEFVGVAGLIIAAAGLWMGWADRRSDVADKAAEIVSEAKARGIVTLSGAVSHDGETMTLSDPAHDVQSVSAAFPSALGVGTQSSVLGPRLSVDWFSDKLLAVTKGKDAGRLPVILTATWWDGDTKHADSATYDLVWRREGTLFGGHKVKMVRLSLRDRSASQTSLDAAWVREASGG
jgi:hypothetical protein